MLYLTNNYIIKKMWKSGESISVSGNSVFEYTHKKNDLRVLLCPILGTNSCSYMRVVHAGSKDEVGISKSGAAHFLEHMSFRIDDGKIWELAAKGDQINANTNLDSTKFFVIHLPGQTEDVLKIDAHRFSNHSVPEDKISVEMQAVKNELLQKHTRTGPRMFAAVTAMAFTAHPYMRQTIGEISDVENSKANEFDNYRDHFYVPNNATLIFTGNFNPQTVLQYVHKYFGNMPKGINCNPVHCPEPAQNGLRISELNISAPCHMLCLAFHTPNGRTKDFLTLKIIANLLWKNRSGRGKQLLTSNILHDIGVYCPKQHDPFLFFFHGTMGGPNPSAPHEMLEILQTFSTVPVNEIDLNNGKRQMVDEWDRSTESPSDIMNAIANGVSIGNWTDVSDRHHILSSITKHDLMRVASTVFRKDNMTITSVMPSSETESQSLPVKVDTPIHRLKAPASLDIRVESEPKANRSMHKIGKTTNVLLSHQAKYARASISARFDPKYSDIASLFVKNSGERKQQQLYNLHSNRNFASDHEFVHLNMELPLDIGKLKQAASLITSTDWKSPHFDEQQIEIIKRQMISEMRTLDQDQAFMTKSTFVKGLFSNTVYNIPITRRIETLERVSADHMKQFHRKWIIGGDNTIVTIVSPTVEIGQKLAKILPTSSQRPVSTMSWKSLPRKPMQNHISLKGYGSIAIMIGQTISIKADNPASVALECASEIFGGGMTGRLMHIVREQKGLGTYGIYSELKSVNSRTDKIFVISGSFSPDSFDAGMQCTKELLADFCQNGITEKELEFAKSRMVGNRKILRDDVTELKQACIDEIISGKEPFASFELFDRRVGELTVSLVNNAITTFLDCTKMIEISCG